jgi:hypothetical protein
VAQSQNCPFGETLHVYLDLQQALCVVGGRGYLRQHLPQHWIGRTIAEDRAQLRWPPRSPDLTPCHMLRTLSFYCFYHRVCLSCETNYRCHLKDRSLHTAAGVVKMGYRLDVCCITKAGYTDHLGCTKKKIEKFPFSSVGRILRSFSPFKCIDFVECVKEF